MSYYFERIYTKWQTENDANKQLKILRTCKLLLLFPLLPTFLHSIIVLVLVFLCITLFFSIQRKNKYSFFILNFSLSIPIIKKLAKNETSEIHYYIIMICSFNLKIVFEWNKLSHQAVVYLQAKIEFEKKSLPR